VGRSLLPAGCPKKSIIAAQRSYAKVSQHRVAMSYKSAHITKQQPNDPKCIDRKTSLCLACGQTPIPKRRRRYCSDKCKKRLDFALRIATGLVQTLRTRYAAFSYTEDSLILDILPVGSKFISRFMWKRSRQKKVADDLLDMVEHAGRDWYAREEETGSRWWASQHLLDKALRRDIPVTTIVPVLKRTPRLNHKEKNALKVLELTKDQILSNVGIQYIRSAYRRKAKVYHPDKGADTADKFIEINEAHAELISWAESPRFCTKTALPNSWCYDASRRRWVPPA
jgi:hypothetical protein